MAWIETLEAGEAEGNLRTLYEGLRKQRGMVPNVMKIFSFHPEAVRATMQMFQTLMYGPAPLGRTQREMIDLVVSVVNRCHY